MAEHNELGILGEKHAKNYLEDKGYLVLCQNYRHKRNEVDIIAEHNNELVVVEVKTRNSQYLSDPSLLISRSKQKSIIEASNAYIHEKEIDLECRFDVIIVISNSKGNKIEHIEGAFSP